MYLTKSFHAEFLEEATILGRPSTKMSPWGTSEGGPLSDDEVIRLVEFIRSWETLPRADIHDMVIEGDAQNGADLYSLHCASCHGANGEGTTLALSLNNPVFLNTASDGFIWHAIEVGRSNTLMGSYSDILTEQEIYDIVAFIRSLES